MTDVTVSGSGTVYLFKLHTPAAIAWAEGKVNFHRDDPELLNSAASFACEHRGAPDLVEGMRSAGLEVTA